MKRKLPLTIVIAILLVFSAGMFAFTYNSSDSLVISAEPIAEPFATTTPAETGPDWDSLLPVPGDLVSDTMILRPVAPGDSTSITSQYPTSGNHWDKVDDTTADEGGSYVKTTAGSFERDLYQITPADEATGTINGITVYYRFSGDSWDEETLDENEEVIITHYDTNGDARAAIKTNGTVYDGSINTRTDGSYTTASETWSTNPDTSQAWTWDDIATLQAGVSLRASGGGGAYGTQVYVSIDYEYNEPPITRGDAPTGDLFDVTVSDSYIGKLLVNVYLGNVADLTKAYNYLNLKLAMDGAAESYSLLTLENGVAQFNLSADGTIGTTWTQSSQAHFESGILDQVDTTTSPGSVTLEAIQGGATIAAEDFESDTWSGGTGWLADWYHEGAADLSSIDVPHGGDLHLRLRNSTGYVDRPVDLSGQTDVRLQFWGKANSFESGEFAEALVSPDGSNWTVVKTWVDGDDDNVYHYNDIDLSAFTMSSQLWIAFDTEMANNTDYLYIDDIKIVTTAVGQYQSLGTLASAVYDTGEAGATWNQLAWDETLTSGTNISFQVRASDTAFAQDAATPVWINLGSANSPVIAGLPSGRYLQWRATLSTSDNTHTPTLHEVRASYTTSAGPTGNEHTISVTGGSYGLGSGDTSEWDEGWTLTPEIYAEVIQK